MNQFECVEQWIGSNREDMISFLQTLLRIPSVTGNEAAIQDFLAEYVKNMGAEVDTFVPVLEELQKHPAFVKSDLPYENRPNVVAVFHGLGTGKSLLFNGHVDVIPEGPEDKWIHGCWSGDWSEGKIYGRGASDMKSGVAAMTMAVLALKSCGIQLKGDVILEYVMDEELTGNGTLACVMKGIQADAGICCETSSMCVQPGSIGRIWFTIKVTGKAAGIQTRYEGVNAIDLGYIVTKAVEAFEKVRLAKVSHPLYPDLLSSIPCMIGQFTSGSYASAFPDSCILKGSMATVPGESSDAVKAEFVEYIRSACAKESKWLAENPPEIIFNGYFAEPSAIPADAPIVAALINEYKNVMHQEPVVSGRQGAADIRHLNTYGNTPTVIFGPGLTEQMHANNEWVYAEDYINAVKILARTIMSWCGTE
ncbi:ArgE/DapE family deacylase [Clostridium transplantifaecale]|uniref:ArgE/DapE family deacylase n=1 Tax=Clostridium transplantifaecale TaxID=2479838 RepID=UPI000F63E702|nr:ArgE/DapE family deacylase [Clostridium transplantifaecale]